MSILFADSTSGNGYFLVSPQRELISMPCLLILYHSVSSIIDNGNTVQCTHMHHLIELTECTEGVGISHATIALLKYTWSHDVAAIHVYDTYS
jgi:hypothetical protein